MMTAMDLRRESGNSPLTDRYHQHIYPILHVNIQKTCLAVIYNNHARSSCQDIPEKGQKGEPGYMGAVRKEMILHQFTHSQHVLMNIKTL